MAEVKVLIEGYAKQTRNGWIASSTVCLITTGDKKIISDPGCNREKLLEALGKENLNTRDIDYVFLSHRHPDHALLAGIFEKTKHITFDAGLMYAGDQLSQFDKNVLGNEIEVINTPGHVNEHISLLVQTPEGKVAIVGDLIWWLDDEEQVLDINQKDHSQTIDLDMKTLVENRRRILEISDYIIPGHGKKFAVKK